MGSTLYRLVSLTITCVTIIDGNEPLGAEHLTHGIVLVRGKAVRCTELRIQADRCAIVLTVGYRYGQIARIPVPEVDIGIICRAAEAWRVRVAGRREVERRCQDRVNLTGKWQAG